MRALNGPAQPARKRETPAQPPHHAHPSRGGPGKSRCRSVPANQSAASKILADGIQKSPPVNKVRVRKKVIWITAKALLKRTAKTLQLINK